MSENVLNRGAGGSVRRDAPPPAGPSKPKPSGGARKLSRNLVALSSAAVLTVYAIGYVRTEPAARQLQASEQAPPTTALSAAPPSATALAGVTGQAAPATGDDATASSAAPTSAAVATAAPTAPAAAPTTAASAPVSSPIPSPATAAAVVRAPTATAVPTRAPTSVPTATPVPAARMKDGTFVGQGFSRHGGIQASVTIKNGKIVSAPITACSTRYPCSVVSELQGEVIQLQGPPVDAVSGATDSSYAYYGAIQQALQQAGWTASNQAG